MRTLFRLFCAGLLLWSAEAAAQAVDTVLLAPRGTYEWPLWNSTFSSVIDRNGAPFIYGACMEMGLVIYGIGDLDAPVPSTTLSPSFFGGLKPTNVEQHGNTLYVSLGGFSGVAQQPGLALLDVSIPDAPVLLGQWRDTTMSDGCAIVRVRDTLAYLGVMEDGLSIVNVSDPAAMTRVSAYRPDTAWPGIVSYPPNGRGLWLQDTVLFLCYDGGALRTIDISDPHTPTQIGQYVNPDQPTNTAVAYNNVVLVGHYAYIASDFCGFEVVDVSDPAQMQPVHWEDPWNCSGLSWFGSPGHTNELITALGDSLLFLSGGDSEVLIYDITTPASPTLVGGLIMPGDSAVTWGLDLRDDLLALNFVDNSLVIFPPQPYYSDWGGIRLYTWSKELATMLDTAHVASPLRAVPMPASDHVVLTGALPHVPYMVQLLDLYGRTVRSFRSTPKLSLEGLSPSTYLVRVIDGDGASQVLRMVKGE